MYWFHSPWHLLVVQLKSYMIDLLVRAWGVDLTLCRDSWTWYIANNVLGTTCKARIRRQGALLPVYIRHDNRVINGRNFDLAQFTDSACVYNHKPHVHFDEQQFFNEFDEKYIQSTSLFWVPLSLNSFTPAVPKSYPGPTQALPSCAWLVTAVGKYAFLWSQGMK